MKMFENTVITAGVDVFDNGINVGIYAWNSENEDLGMVKVFDNYIYGDISKEWVWDSVEEIISDHYYINGSQSGYCHVLRSAMIDSGFNTGKAYEFCQRPRIQGISRIVKFTRNSGFDITKVSCNNAYGIPVHVMDVNLCDSALLESFGLGAKIPDTLRLAYAGMRLSKAR